MTMLDTLKERLDDARSRLILASQEHQAAAIKLQQVTNECNIWNSAVALETREEEKRLARANENQIPINLPEFVNAPKSDSPTIQQETSDETTTSTLTTSKTQKVRDILAEHATGVTPSGIWTEVKDHVSSRAYLYAILKRLRDNEEVSVRRGKYFLKPRPVQMEMEGVERVVIQ